MKIKHFSIILIVVLLLAATIPQGAFAQEDWPRVISMGAASVGGTMYLVGGILSEVWSEVGVNASVEESGGSFHNTMLINTGDLHTAQISQGAAWEAWTGTDITGLFEKDAEEYRNMRAIHPQHVSYLHGWTVADDVDAFRDLDGKIVSGGPAGGTSDFWFRMVLDILGVNPSRVVHTSLGDTVNLMRDNLLDLGCTSGGVPTPAANEAAATLDAKIVGVKYEEDIEKIREKMPFFSALEIPIGPYPGFDEKVLTVADWNVYFAHKDLPEDMVYQYTKAIFENLDRLYEGFAGLRTITPDSVKNIVLPLHPGAYRYYQEAGIEVHPDAVPVD
jgi:hypothetical protein